MALRRPQSYRSKTPRKRTGNRTSCKGDTRIIHLGKATPFQYPDNEIISSKYTIWTFLPKNLYEQFRRIANFYFLCMAIIAFSIESPVSPLTSFLPLLFVVTVTGVKQAYEDYLRHKADRQVNNHGVTVLRNGVPQEIPAKKIHVGDIVRLQKDDDVPCDIVLLVSSHPESKCFVTTANLDGETNLKTLYCPRTLKRNMTEIELGQLDATVECENPTANLYKYHGRLQYGPKTRMFLKQSMIKRGIRGSQRFPRGPHCCYADCPKCGVRLRSSQELGGSEDSIRCECQCKTRGIKNVEEEAANEAIRAFDMTVKAFEEELDGKHKVTAGRSSSLSNESDQTDEPLSKVNSYPDMGLNRQNYGSTKIDSNQKSAMRKTHKKTESNVSRVSFNIDPSRRDSDTSHKDWTLERKTSILIRRNSALLKSKRLSVSSNDSISDPLGAENLLLRGSRLKNTDFIYGCAVYTGQDTKLALNSKVTNNKFSTIERSVNKFLVFYLILLTAQVVISTILKILRESSIGMKAESDKKFRARVLNGEGEVTAYSVVVDFFTFVVLYNYVIPISLYVTMEMQKFLGTLFFEWDLNMYDPITDEVAMCNTSDLNEDLGQIEYLFTDKTGTLTENCMHFRRCSVNGRTFIEMHGALYPLQIGEDRIGEFAVDISTCDEAMEKFLLALALCHTVQVEERPEEEDGEKQLPLTFSASSPDEKALVEAMQALDIVFTNDADDFIVLRILGQEKIYERLNVFEFTSDRKRMSVIVKDEEGNIHLFCKGAESAVMPLVLKGPTDETLHHVAEFASRGLRTLMVGYKSFTEEEYISVSNQVQRVRGTLSSDRDKVVAKTYEKVENGLTLLGATGVEDQLQEGVQETLESLAEAGVKVWILTGDKVETAVNISMSCGHLKRSTIKLMLVGKKDGAACKEALLAYKDKVTYADSGTTFGLIVDGESLGVALEEHKDLLREVCMKCFAVICCRMSPLQKSEVVQLVKTSESNPVTAAVGDGANDVSMIQEAHVGLGIIGKEGRQAVRCSDFAFAKFRFLREAFLVHGHWYYLRVATLVQYFFYKNIVFILPQFYFLFYNGYSTQPLYDSMYLTCYNIIFTSLPILVYGLLEQNFPAERLRAQPKLYKVHKLNRLMTWRHFFKWFALGLWHSVVIFFVPLIYYGINSNIMPHGRDSYLELFGTQIYHSSVTVVNLKLWLHSHYWCGPFIGSLAFSLLAWFLLACLYSIVFIKETASIYYTFLHLCASPSMWLISLLIAVICLIPDFFSDACSILKLAARSSPIQVMSLVKMKAATVYQ